MELKENTADDTLLYNDINKRSIHNKLYLRTVVLLDNYSTMDLLCNPYLFENIKKAKGPLRIKLNGG